MRVRPFAKLALPLAAAAVGVAIVAWGRPGPPIETPSAAVPCSANAGAVIRPGDLEQQFITMGNNYQSYGPVGLSNNQAFRSYNGGRLTGLLASIAMANRYKAEQDARARTLHYSPGPWPILPLQGSVVAENPGALEIYQANWSFSDRADARAFYSDIVASLRSSSGGKEFNASSVARTDEASGWTFTPPNADVEDVVDVDFRIGGTVVQVGIRGGHQLTSSYGINVATLASNKVRLACSLGT